MTASIRCQSLMCMCCLQTHRASIDLAKITRIITCIHFVPLVFSQSKQEEITLGPNPAQEFGSRTWAEKYEPIEASTSPHQPLLRDLPLATSASSTEPIPSTSAAGLIPATPCPADHLPGTAKDTLEKASPFFLHGGRRRCGGWW
jgi:hypothetical protein